MGQIVKKKKKGRPSKADLAKLRSLGKDTSATDRELRRSHRQRNVRYTFDFDDYLDDDELFEDFDDEEDERRREKKLKVLLKLQTSRETATTTTESTPSETRRVSHAPSASQSSSDLGGEGSNRRPSKKRKMSGSGRQVDDGELEPEEDEEDENDDADVDDNENVEDDEVVKGGGGKADEPKGVVEESAPGTPIEVPSGLPLPEKKKLELILDKLQKKDIYGVYAEPVDPEELPDYREVIEHPMDFASVRNKLGNGSYATLEQFESDVFLICSNAMQYNAPDTIYHKQARSIQELAKKKFQKIRLGIERSEELKSEQKTGLSSVVKKPIRKPISRTLQDSVGSDFSSGATLATTGDFQNGSSIVQAFGSERASSVDRLVEGGPPLIDNNIDKAEESLPGKRPLPKIERKPSLNDDNRRATYNNPSQPVASSDSVLSTFEGESKQLVSVGLYADHAYARSLARFAATLGPVAWRIASKRIEQVLPPGSKFGRGWVGEYEALPTPVLMLENCTLKEPPFFTKVEPTVVTRKEDKIPTKPDSSKENILTEPHAERLTKIAPSYKDSLVKDSTQERKSAFFGPTLIKPTATSSPSISLPAKEQAVRVAGLEGRSFFGSPPNKTTFSASSLQQQNSQPRNFIEPEKKVVKQVELNGPPSGSRRATDFVVDRQVLNSSETAATRSKEKVPKNKNLLPSGSFKQHNVNGVSAGLPNGKVNVLDSNKMSSSSSDVAKAASYFYVQDQGLTDPVQLMRMLTDNAQNLHKSSNQSPLDSSPLVPPSPSLRKEDSGNAAAAAAHAWMSIGAGGLRPAGENTNPHKNKISADSMYNPARDLQLQVSRFRGDSPSHGMHFQPEKNSFPFHPFVPQPTRICSDAQFQNQQMVYPQLVTADLSRFPVQSPWQSLSPQVQPRQKQESLPPDLNISFQSSGSPGRPASGVLVDSQQPDLALQL
ncbi:hypothetical protein ACH5RR_037974 [Cinchona calisaya]|uniref:Bromo domain-containing protein n=1 Tax=Cinchona calisaya TaxID=153742 RepID=A0ABD2Y8W3_9GENT